MHLPSTSSERGSALVVVMFLTILLAALSLGLLGEGMAERAAVRTAETSMGAFELAELGLTQAELEIRSTADADKDGLGTLQRTFEHGTFSVVAKPGSTPDVLVLTSTGTEGLSRRTIEVVLRGQAARPWTHGIIGRDSLYIKNDGKSYKWLKDAKSKDDDDSSKDKKSKRVPPFLEVDAYDSRLGTYAAQSANPAGWPHMDQGKVASNGPVTLEGMVKVYGDASPGPAGAITTIKNGAQVTGSTDPLSAPLLLPDPPLPDFEAAYAANDNLLLAGLEKSRVDDKYNARLEAPKKTLTLPAGTYLFHDFKVAKDTNLEVAGPVKIYVTGNVRIEEGVTINSKGRPGDVQIIAHPYQMPYLKKAEKKDKKVIQIRTDLACAFALYAPQRDFDWKDKQDLQLSGSLVGRNFDMRSKAKNNSPKLHYDISLDAINFSFTETTRIAWRELSISPR